MGFGGLVERAARRTPCANELEMENNNKNYVLDHVTQKINYVVLDHIISITVRTLFE